MDYAESPPPWPLTGSGSGIELQPAGDEQVGGERALQTPAPARPAAEPEDPDGEEWVPV